MQTYVMFKTQATMQGCERDKKLCCSGSEEDYSITGIFHCGIAGCDKKAGLQRKTR
ncbi:hypothetical protein BDV28DRAFT_126473 [Aspergillus coremiiformis]|uniref:Uncharacterized protein n=1 Tax=Aspergillus coremiiformis TaxID=138285 RepID=A0A5N6ZHQ9_9EURO|nr:hypothetical protein BDV28DRAFT_126473 [Aspergillus coremiiformis]